MLKEALEYLFDRADNKEEQKHVRKVDVPSDGRHVLLEHDGKLIDRDIPPGLRKHKVDTVDDLVLAAKRWNTNPVVWVSEAAVTLVIDDADRRDVVTCPLVKTALFRKLTELRHTGSPMDQESLIRLLRTDFKAAMNQPVILGAVRKIKFRSLTEGHAEVQHGNESLGRLVENEVSGASALPEGLQISTPVYLRIDLEGNVATIDLCLEIHAKTQKFALQPVPDQIEEATSQALLAIQRKLDEELPDVPVFFGSP